MNIVVVIIIIIITATYCDIDRFLASVTLCGLVVALTLFMFIVPYKVVLV